MSWRAGDPGFPPSPDPAAAAERHYAEQSWYEEPEDDRCPMCGDHGVILVSLVGQEEAEVPCPDCSAPRTFPRGVPRLRPQIDSDDDEVPF